jgi:allantoicase
VTEAPAFVNDFVNLADPQAGAAVLFVSDEFFAPAKRMLDAREPLFLPDRFDAHGKWMDGWESRRRRDQEYDHCVIRIRPGIVHGLDIDTRHFIGNYPQAASVEACRVGGDPDQHCTWTELVPRTNLQPDSHHWFEVEESALWSHLRLNIFPDGGVARFRVYGEAEQGFSAHPDWIDLSSQDCGGRAVFCNDMHFGHMDNLLAPGPSLSMADGWETRRRRTRGNDFVVVRLGKPGHIRRVELDTAHFLGNYPAQCALSGALLEHDPSPEDSVDWLPILARSAMGPDQLHVFERQLRQSSQVLSHVRLDIFPDGGVARMRLFGEPADPHG